MASKKKRHDPTYAALASGPGSFKRAMEAALERPAPSEPARREPPPLPNHRAQTVPSSGGADPADVAGVDSAAPPAIDGSPAYRRVLEELSIYVVPQVADRLLRRCLEEEGSSPATAIPYDLRAILVDALPRRLRRVLSAERAAAAVEALEQALVNVHSPPSARRRTSSSGELSSASSTPPT